MGTVGGSMPKKAKPKKLYSWQYGGGAQISRLSQRFGVLSKDRSFGRELLALGVAYVRLTRSTLEFLTASDPRSTEIGY
jgi:hypothetical protein